MSLRYSNQQFLNATTEIGTAVTVAGMTIAIPPVDISHYDKFCIMFQNRHTAINFLNLHVQAAMDTSAVDIAPNWVQINTGTLPQPSALGATASVLTSAVDNAYKYIRVLAAMSATAGLNTLRIQIGGFMRS